MAISPVAENREYPGSGSSTTNKRNWYNEGTNVGGSLYSEGDTFVVGSKSIWFSLELAW